MPMSHDDYVELKLLQKLYEECSNTSKQNILEVISCKDCKNSSEPRASRLTLYENNYEICYCSVFDKNLPDEFFCCCAEKREEE
jgi:hypothetical protein